MIEGSIDAPPIVLRSDRRKLLLAVIGAIGFVALGFWIISDQPQSLKAQLVGMLSVAFFGYIAAIGVAKIVRPGRLELSPQGLRSSSLGRSIQFTWGDVSNFRIVRYRQVKQVGFDVASASTLPDTTRQLARKFYDCDAVLGGGWPLSPAKLAELLAEARRRWA